MTKPPATLGDRIFELRVTLGERRRPLSFQGLADRLAQVVPDRRYNTTTLQRWETNQGEPDLVTLKALATLAQQSLHEFAFGVPETPTAAPGVGTAVRVDDDERATGAPRATTAGGAGEPTTGPHRRRGRAG